MKTLCNFAEGLGDTGLFNVGVSIEFHSILQHRSVTDELESPLQLYRYASGTCACFKSELTASRSRQYSCGIATTAGIKKQEHMA